MGPVSPSPVLSQAVPIISGDRIPPTSARLGSELNRTIIAGQGIVQSPWHVLHLSQKANNSSRATLLRETEY